MERSKIYSVRLMESDKEQMCYSYDEAVAYAKGQMELHHEAAVIQEFELTNTVIIEKGGAE